MKRLWHRYSIVLTVIIGIAMCPILLNFKMPAIDLAFAQPVWVKLSIFFFCDTRTRAAIICHQYGITNIYPGLAMIKSYGYQPHVSARSAS